MVPRKLASPGDRPDRGGGGGGGVGNGGERSQPVMDAMADAGVKDVISVPRAPPWKRARYTALIGPTVAGLFAAAQL